MPGTGTIAGRVSQPLSAPCAAALALALAAAPAQAFDKRRMGPADASCVHLGVVSEAGYTADRPWYLDPQFGTRAWYRAYRPNPLGGPVYVEPSYRFTGGYPWSYPSTGYVFRYSRCP